MRTASTESSGTQVRRASFSSMMGTALEGYDFFLYGSAAALIFPQLFFHASDPWTATLLSLSTFAVGFVARPVGGIVAGHIGDKIGRKPMLIATLTLIGLATMAIGLLPTYQQVGIVAPIALTAIRLIQGLAYGGEWGGASLMIVESAPDDRRGAWGSLQQAASPLGYILASAVLWSSEVITGEDFLTWGWRIPFIVSIVPVGLGLYIRLHVSEPKAFRQVDAGEHHKIPLVVVVRQFPRRLALAVGSVMAIGASYFLIVTFMLSYGSNIGVSRSTLLTGVVIAAVGQGAASLITGALSDRVGRRLVYVASGGFLVLYMFPMFLLVNTGLWVLIWIALAIGLVGHGSMYGPLPAYMAEMFDTRIRYSAVSTAFQIGQLIGGGLTPVVGAALVGIAGGAFWPVAVYCMCIYVISIICVTYIGETRGTSITVKEEVA